MSIQAPKEMHTRLTLFVRDRRTKSSWSICAILWLSIWLQIIDGLTYCTSVNFQTLRPTHCGVACHALPGYRVLVAFLRCVSRRSLPTKVGPGRIPVYRCIIVCSIIDVGVRFQMVLLFRLSRSAKKGRERVTERASMIQRSGV
jgi:hypothetical protein